jgi:hypothetical protein
VNVERQEGARNVTMEISDGDYAVLRRAVEWLQEHAGNDAPEYPDLQTATRVVGNIAQRREQDSSKRRPPSPFTGAVVHIRPATGDDAERASSEVDGQVDYD